MSAFGEVKLVASGLYDVVIRNPRANEAINLFSTSFAAFYYFTTAVRHGCSLSYSFYLSSSLLIGARAGFKLFYQPQKYPELFPQNPFSKSKIKYTMRSLLCGAAGGMCGLMLCAAVANPQRFLRASEPSLKSPPSHPAFLQPVS